MHFVIYIKYCYFNSGLGFFLNGLLLPNNSMVEPSTIGMNDDALFCITNLKNCCSSSPNSNHARGLWIFPNQTNVPSKSSQTTSFFRTRSSSSIILHRNSNHGYTNSSGLYNCTIPDSDEKLQYLYVFITDRKYDYITFFVLHFSFFLFLLQIRLTYIFWKLILIASSCLSLVHHLVGQ